MPPIVKAFLTVLLLTLAARVQAQPEEAAPPPRDPEAGHPFITSFAPADYGAAEPNWAVVEDERGVIYVGNSGGILEYDGVSWRLLPLPNASAVRSLARDGEGRIWVGGKGDLGYLAPDRLGRTAFVSLREEVPEADRDFVDVWKTHATEEGIYFSTHDALFRWDGREMAVWHPERTFHLSFLVDGTLYVREWERGLMRMEPNAAGGSLRLVPDGERFAQTRIYAMLPFDEGRILIGTREEGLFLWDGAHFEPFETEADKILAEGGLYVGGGLPGGRFALGTYSRGLVVVNRAGRLLLHLDRETGLPHDAVYSTYEDATGHLWLGTQHGLARVETGSPFTCYGEESGVTSTARALARHEGRLYAAHSSSGITYLDAESGTFRPVRNAPTQNGEMLPVAGDLLVAGGPEGVYRIRGVRAEPVRVPLADDYSAATLHAWSRNPQTVFVGLFDGLAVLQHDGAGWADAGRVPGVEMAGDGIAEAPDGTLWLSSILGRPTRVRLPEPGAAGVLDLDRAEVTVFGPEDGLPEGTLVPYRVGGRIYFSAHGERLFRYDEEAERFIEDHTFDKAKSGHPLARLSLREDEEGHVWIGSIYGAPVVARLRPSGGYTFETFGRFRDSRIRWVRPESDSIVWMGGEGELIRFDTRQEAVRSSTHPPLIRRVTIGEDDLRYGGAGAASETEVAHSADAVRFAYAAPGGAGAARYRTRLEGFDEGGSAWTAETERAYTNLPPGAYRFVVEAEGRGEAAYALTVLPPWYRTWWAYGLFGLATTLLLLMVYRYRTRHLYRRQRELDAQVAARTRELRAEKQKTEAQSERLREMDRLKSRFFANVSHEFRTPLTLTIGPLEDLQRDEAASLPTVVQKKVGLALRNSRLLLRLIGQLLDIAKLEAGELRLDARRHDLAAFVRGTARSFAPLAERRRVRFSVEAPEVPVPVVFDAEKLEQVLVNLLSNAFKFTPEGGAIHVSVADETDGGGDTDNVLVIVRDSGSGIPAEALPHLFERFYQADETYSEVQPGTGIGLSLAKDLTELHGGTITVESAVGFGTTFTVRLPHDSPLGDAEAPDVAPVAPALLAHGDGWPGDGREEAPVLSDEAEEPDDDRTTILVADDNAEIRAFVRSHLEGGADGYRVLEAADGRAALETARAALPDLIVSDVRMPHLDGFELVQALRADRETDFIPVILLTARATEEDKIEGLGEGADAYLTKPFSVHELQAHVENLLASRQRLKERFAAIPSAPAASPDGLDALSPSDEAYLARARAVVEAHLDDEDFSVEHLAASMEQNRSTLYRRLRDILGQTPTAFIRGVRLERAAVLLREQCGTVSEIAYAVGFKSVSHFSQSFRDVYDVTPSAYLDEVPNP